MKGAKSTISRTDQVDEFMRQLDHPLKAEVELIRGIIKSVDSEVTEQIKWNAPSFSYRGEYLVTFNLRDHRRIHLVFHNPMIVKVESPLLEGDYVDRRMAYFAGRDDVQTRRSLLEDALRDLIELQPQKGI